MEENGRSLALGYLTLQLKIHRPSAVKRRVMEQAIERYALALNDLTARRWEALSACIAAGDTSRLGGLADAQAMGALNRLGVQPFKDSIKAEFTAFARACMARGKPLGEFRPLKKRSVYFGRKSDSRDYCLLTDGQGRFYVKMTLLNAGEALTGYPAGQRKELSCILPGLPPCGGLARNKRRFVICPLSFGRGTHELLKELIDDPGRLGTARLTERGGEFYLYVSVAAPAAKATAETGRFLGVARGKQGVGWSLWSRSNDSVPAFADGEFAWEGRYLTAKRILGLAEEHGARIVYEAKGCRDDGASALFGEQALPWRDYARLCETLTYKAEWRGLAPPVGVSANGIHFCCPACGSRTKHSLQREEVFLCIHCGTATEVRCAASRSLARRLDYYGSKKLVFSARKLPGGIAVRQELLGFSCTAADEAGFLLELEGFLCEGKKAGRKAASAAAKLRAAPSLKDAVLLEFE